MLTENVPPPVQGQAFEKAKELADECGILVENLLASQDDRIPKAVVAPKPQFVMGRPLVSKDDLPTNMRYLHKWYLSESKNGRTMIVLSVPQEYYGRSRGKLLKKQRSWRMNVVSWLKICWLPKTTGYPRLW